MSLMAKIDRIVVKLVLINFKMYGECPEQLYL